MPNIQTRSKTELTNLTLIRNGEYHQKVETVLKNCHPTDNQRLWLVGFLNFVGYTSSEIMEIIKLKGAWHDYNEQITEKRIEYALNRDRRRGAPAARVESAANTKQPPAVCSLTPQRVGLYPPHSLDEMVSKSVDECAPYSCRTYVDARFCQLSCETCQDLKCVEALRYLNDNTMQNMQSRNRN